MKIGLVSDTHGYFDDQIASILKGCDEIWHAGDIGDLKLLDRLSCIAPLRCVYGNIDDASMRVECPEIELFTLAGLKFLMIHIAGSFSRYNSKVRKVIEQEKPDVLICGHSHILKVAYDKRFNLLYMNPGATGHHGFHIIRTLLLFEVRNDKIEDLKVVELGKRGRSRD